MKDRHSERGRKESKSKIWGEAGVRGWVKGASQAIHSNGSHRGQPEAWVPHSHLRYLRAGGDSDGAGEMLSPLTPSPW